MRSNVFVPRFIAFRCLRSHASIAHLNPANLSASTKSTEPAHGARGVFHSVSAGQDPSARRCAYLDRPSVASGESRAHGVPRHAQGGSYDHHGTIHPTATPKGGIHAGPGAA